MVHIPGSARRREPDGGRSVNRPCRCPYPACGSRHAT